jgi:hypothetical protein
VVGAGVTALNASNAGADAAGKQRVSNAPAKMPELLQLSSDEGFGSGVIFAGGGELVTSGTYGSGMVAAAAATSASGTASHFTFLSENLDAVAAAQERTRVEQLTHLCTAISHHLSDELGIFLDELTTDLRHARDEAMGHFVESCAAPLEQARRRIEQVRALNPGVADAALAAAAGRGPQLLAGGGGGPFGTGAIATGTTTVTADGVQLTFGEGSAGASDHGAAHQPLRYFTATELLEAFLDDAQGITILKPNRRRLHNLCRELPDHVAVAAAELANDALLRQREVARQHAEHETEQRELLRSRLSTGRGDVGGAGGAGTSRRGAGSHASGGGAGSVNRRMSLATAGSGGAGHGRTAHSSASNGGETPTHGGGVSSETATDGNSLGFNSGGGIVSPLDRANAANGRRRSVAAAGGGSGADDTPRGGGGERRVSDAMHAEAVEATRESWRRYARSQFPTVGTPEMTHHLRYVLEAWRLALLTLRVEQVADYDVEAIAAAVARTTARVVERISDFVLAVCDGAEEQSATVQQLTADRRELVLARDAVDPLEQTLQQRIAELQASLGRISIWGGGPSASVGVNISAAPGAASSSAQQQQAHLAGAPGAALRRNNVSRF